MATILYTHWKCDEESQTQFCDVNISCLFCHNWEGHFSHVCACAAGNYRLHFHTSTSPADQCLISGPHIYVFLHFDLSEGANYRMTSAALLAAYRPPCRLLHYISNEKSTGENTDLRQATCFLTYWGWHLSIYIYIYIGRSNTRLHSIAGCFINKTLNLSYDLWKLEESRTSPKCNYLFLGPLSTFLEFFIKSIHNFVWKQVEGTHNQSSTTQMCDSTNVGEERNERNTFHISRVNTQTNKIILFSILTFVSDLLFAKIIASLHVIFLHM